MMTDNEITHWSKLVEDALNLAEKNKNSWAEAVGEYDKLRKNGFQTALHVVMMEIALMGEKLKVLKDSVSNYDTFMMIEVQIRILLKLYNHIHSINEKVENYNNVSEFIEKELTHVD